MAGGNCIHFGGERKRENPPGLRSPRNVRVLRGVSAFTLHAPAKLNLFLAVTGRRADGFHDLVSLVATVDHGDELQVSPKAYGGDELICDAPEVPTDGTNLVLRAAQAWRAAGGLAGPVRFTLRKQIPAGAGLGGGSSDAVAALRALQRLATTSLSSEQLLAVAATLGSDCPLFLADGPAVMRGRGEQLSPLPSAAVALLAGQRVLIAKPFFGIETPWAYGRLAAAAPKLYTPPAEAETRLAAWLEGRAALEPTLMNSFEAVAFSKFVALPTLGARLREQLGLALHLTGSGSACFALLPGDPAVAERALTLTREAFGPDAFAVVTRIRQKSD